jgi:hypothetical protein
VGAFKKRMPRKRYSVFASLRSKMTGLRRRRRSCAGCGSLSLADGMSGRLSRGAIR